MTISTDELTNLGASTQRGRPWAERAVWGALWILSTGDSPDWLADHQPSRIRRRLGSLRPGGLLWAARNRAAVHRFRANERVVKDLMPHVLISGAGAIGYKSGVPHLEGYVTPDRFDWIRTDFPVVPDDSSPDLILRVSNLAACVDGDFMPIAFAAADMATSNQVSEAERGLLILDDLLRSFQEEPRDWLTASEIAQVIADQIEPGDEMFALRILAKALSDARTLTEPADIVRFLQPPPTTSDDRWDVLLAAAVARECRLRGIDPPPWTDIQGLEPWWFPGLVDEVLIPLTIQRTPPELSSKGIWLDERALTAV